MEKIFQISISILPALSTPFSLLERKRLQWKRFFCFVFFTLVTSAVSPRVQRLSQSGWYSEEILKLELDQTARELLDPDLLPEKCLCNYTVNMVFMPMLYKTY